MIIKYFGKGKGTSGAVEYVERNETAKTLKGDNDITRDLISSNTNKLKYRSGVISFGTDKPTKEQVQEIISEFEKSTFAGLEEDQYNILWVEHTDNPDNYHIHFVIPRLELSSMKAFNPHYHKADQKRLLLLQNYINNKFDLINPFSSDRRQTLEIKTNWENRNKAKETINEVVTNAISQSIINNRDELVEFLENSGLEVKISKNYIAIKSDNDKKFIRLKGAYYNENYTSREKLTEELTRTEQEHRTDTSEEFNKLREELERLVQYKARQVSKQYARRVNTDKQFETKNNDNNINTKHSSRYDDNAINTTNTMDSTKRDAVHDRQSEVYQSNGNRTKNIRNNTKSQIYTNQGVNNNDSIRTTTTRSTNPSQDEEQQLIRNSKAVRERIQEQYINYNRRIQEHIRTTTQNIQEDIREHTKRTRYTQSKSIRRITDITEQATKLRESRYNNTRTIEDITGQYQLKSEENSKKRRPKQNFRSR